MKEKIFAWFWKRRLEGRQVIRVTGWRSALVEDKFAGRWHTTFLIQIWKGKYI